MYLKSGYIYIMKGLKKSMVGAMFSLVIATSVVGAHTGHSSPETPFTLWMTRLSIFLALGGLAMTGGALTGEHFDKISDRKKIDIGVVGGIAAFIAGIALYLVI